MSDIVYAKYPWDGKCPRCSGTKLQDGTSAGSCWEHICRECNAHFDDPPDPADSEEPSQSNPAPTEVTADAEQAAQGLRFLDQMDQAGFVGCYEVREYMRQYFEKVLAAAKGDRG